MSSSRYTIYSKRCWLEGKLQPAGIVMQDGKIIGLESSDRSAHQHAGDAVIMPGIIDAHVHINEPGRTDWEGFDTATRAAAAGGITTLVDMPLNSSPVTTTVSAFQEKLSASENKMHVHVGFYGGLIPGNTADLEGLIKAGVLGIKCFLVHSGIDEFPNARREDLEAGMPVLAALDIPLLVHAELDTIPADTHLRELPSSYREYVNSRPDTWETRAIDLMLALCEKYKCPTHIVHVSSAQSLEHIRAAKQKGLPLTAETCSHYIYFCEEQIPDARCLFKCAPPIRSRANNDLLIQALKEGVLNFIATDHSPAPPDRKELTSGNLYKAWGGIAGLQLCLPVSWTALHKTVTLESFIPMLTEGPAHFLKVADRKGVIREGADADLCVWDPDASFIVDEKKLYHKHKASPYQGCNLTGIVQETIVQGKPVWNGSDIIHLNAGTWLLRK